MTDETDPAGIGGPDAARPAATIIDVAAAAGVSRQTVTRAMHDMPGISAPTRARVLAAADALSYRPSRFGRGLVSGGRRQLGLVVDDLMNPYSPELAAAVVRRAADTGWDVLLVDVGQSNDPGATISHFASQVDVVVGNLGARAAEWIGLLGPVPVVELDPAGTPLGAAVLLDRSAAIEDLAVHLAATGSRRPVVLDPADESTPRASSIRGGQMTDALPRHGLQPTFVTVPAPTADAAAAVTAELLGTATAPDVVIAFNDLMAVGVLGACHRAGVAVPDQVRVVGVDGLTLGTYVNPTLTTLDVDLDEVGRHALELAVGLTTGSIVRTDPGAVRRVQHRLLRRGSA